MNDILLTLAVKGEKFVQNKINTTTAMNSSRSEDALSTTGHGTP